MMNIIRTEWKKIIAGLMLSLMISVPALSVYAALDPENVKVTDDADLFTDSEEEILETLAKEAADSVHMDVVIVTTNDTGSKTSEEYADDFFDYNGYGTGKQASGALLLINMEERELWISTSGTMIRFLTDSRIDTMLDHEYSYASSGDYAGAAESFIADIGTYYKKGIESGQYNYDSETGEISRYRSIRWYEAAIAAAVSFFSAIMPCVGVKNEYAMKTEKKAALNYNMAYRALAAFAFATVADNLIDKSVSQRIIPANTGSGGSGSSSGGHYSGRSTTHHSSSGRSHGGGGRHF